MYISIPTIYLPIAIFTYTVLPRSYALLAVTPPPLFFLKVGRKKGGRNSGAVRYYFFVYGNHFEVTVRECEFNVTVQVSARVIDYRAMAPDDHVSMRGS